jgi:hypothetical protein
MTVKTLAAPNFATMLELLLYKPAFGALKTDGSVSSSAWVTFG